MRKSICVLAVVCLMTVLTFAAAGDLNGRYNTQENAYGDWVAFSAVATGGALNVGLTLPSVHTIQWVTTGTPTSCTLQLQGTVDGTNYFSIGAAQTCTSSGAYSVSGYPVQNVRPNLTALGGGTAPTVTVFYAGSHSGASAVTTSSGAAYTEAAHGINSSGTGYGASVALGEFDDTSPTACTENQFCAFRLSSRRALYVEGPVATGVAITGLQPVFMGCDSSSSGTVTAGQVQAVRCGLDGMPVLNALANSDASIGTNSFVAIKDLTNNARPLLVGWALATNGTAGTTFAKPESASLANFPTSQTTTARNAAGVQITERGSRWSVIHNPAANSQATASIASEASVRHVVDCVSFSAAATTAPALTALTINVRDGASGAGTIIWTYQVVIPAATGQSVAPHSICGLNLVGTTATAMTVEFSAGLTSLIESVSISGFNVI